MAALRPLLLAAVSACLLVAFGACSGDDDAAGPTGGPTAVPSDAFILYRDSSASIIARNLATEALFEYPADLETGAIVATACSPDGSRIAYTEFDGSANEYGISLLDVTTGETTALASGKGVAGSPSWSINGATIAYSVQDVLTTVSSVFLLDATEGGTPVRVEASEDLLYYDPEWSPDGSTLLVAGQSETETQLYEVDPESGNAEKFTTSNVYKRRPRYSPDGETIAYTGSVIAATVSRNVAVLHQFGIFLLDADGGNERALTADPRLNPGAGIDPELDAFLMDWCRPGPWLDDSWSEVVETAAP